MSLQNLSNLKPQTKWLKLWKVWNLLCATVIQHLKVAKNGDICKNRYSTLINFASNINIKIKRVAFLCSFLSKPEKLTTSKRLEARKEGWVGQSQYEVRQIQIQNKIQKRSQNELTVHKYKKLGWTGPVHLLTALHCWWNYLSTTVNFMFCFLFASDIWYSCDFAGPIL